MDSIPDICIKSKDMQRHQDNVSELEASNINDQKKQTILKNRELSILTSSVVITLLGCWMMLCYRQNLFFDEAVICSAIIIALLFFREAQQDEDLMNL